MKGKKVVMILKIDLQKAFDRIEWSFIRDTLLFFNFPSKLINLIMSCFSTSSVKVIVNGRKTDVFFPFRGIRQGDPMSPYIFILCMEMLSRIIDGQVNSGLWNPLKITKGDLPSHISSLLMI